MLAVGERRLGSIDRRLKRLTSVFAGGVGGSRAEMCGALSAGVMIIGALHGRSELSEDEEESGRMARGFRERFCSEYGSTQCAIVREKHLAPDGSTNCTPVVERAAVLLLETLDGQESA
jgi:C_GCAxxG_C_C family probable redox protein